MTALVCHDTISTRARHKMARNDANSCKSQFIRDLRRCTISQIDDKRRKHRGNGLLIRRFRVRFPGGPRHVTEQRAREAGPSLIYVSSG
jgi:hypothetical protein